MAIQRGDLDAKLNLEPNEKFDVPEPEQKKPDSVQPARQRKARQQAGKTASNTVDKPLATNEMDAVKQEETVTPQSDPVQVDKATTGQVKAGD